MGVQYIALDFVCTCIASGDFPYISEEPVGSTLYKIWGHYLTKTVHYRTFYLLQKGQLVYLLK